MSQVLRTNSMAMRLALIPRSTGTKGSKGSRAQGRFFYAQKLHVFGAQKHNIKTSWRTCFWQVPMCRAASESNLRQAFKIRVQEEKCVFTVYTLCFMVFLALWISMISISGGVPNLCLVSCWTLNICCCNEVDLQFPSRYLPFHSSCQVVLLWSVRSFLITCRFPSV